MINVIGLGYIGLPTALMMASHGVDVIGTDYNKQLVDTLNEGRTTFKEEGLDELFQKRYMIEQNFGQKTTLKNFVQQHCFYSWKNRGRCIDVDDFLNTIGYPLDPYETINDGTELAQNFASKN